MKILDPAVRTLVVSPEFDLKVRKSLKRIVGKIHRRLLLRYFIFKFGYFLLKIRLFGVRILSRFLRPYR